MDKNDFLKQALYKTQEASWCRTCARRIICQDKEAVAMVQCIVSLYPVKHLEVSVKCRLYIKDINCHLRRKEL